MASDEDRNGNIFQAETDVLADLVTSPADRKALVIPVATPREKNPAVPANARQPSCGAGKIT